MTAAPPLDADLATGPRVAWPSVLLTASVCALAGCGAALAALGHRGAGALCVYLAGWCGFTVLHEASHGNIARSRWINALAGELAASVMLCRFLAFRQIHLRHHRYTNDPRRDPDRFTGDGPWWQRPFRLAVTDLHYYAEYEPRALRAAPIEHRLSTLSAVALGALFLALLGTGHVLDVLLVWVLPLRASMFTAALFVDYLPHMRPTAPTRADDPLGHTAQLAPSPLSDALSLCHTHHLLHHLWPKVPFYRLPAAWRRHGPALRDRGVTVRWG
ncbi:MAG: fatty acid desaturase [Polyangiales bacterium]